VQFRDATDAASLTCQPEERLVQATIKPGLNMCKRLARRVTLGDSGQGEMPLDPPLCAAGGCSLAGGRAAQNRGFWRSASETAYDSGGLGVATACPFRTCCQATCVRRPAPLRASRLTKALLRRKMSKDPRPGR
jgi:hypothetical protein